MGSRRCVRSPDSESLARVPERLTESHPAVHESLLASAALAKPPQENQVKIEVKARHGLCGVCHSC